MPIERRTKKKSRRAAPARGKPQDQGGGALAGFIPQKGDSKGELVRKCIFLVAIVVLICSLTYICIYFYNSESNKKQVNGLKDMLGQDGSSVSVNGEMPDGYLQKFSKLYEANPDIRAWIKIEDTIVDYPVMQAEDNDKYLRHDFYHNYKEHGVPFLDYRSDITKDGSNLVVYSHNMRDGQMFGALPQYKDVSYYREHPLLQFDTIYEESQWKIFAVFLTNVKPEHGTVFQYHNFIVPRSEDEYNWYVDEVKKRSFYDTGIDVKPGDTLLTLSTCTYEFSDARFVVVARKVRDKEDAKVDTGLVTENPNPLMPDVWYELYGGTKPDVVSLPNPEGNSRQDVKPPEINNPELEDADKKTPEELEAEATPTPDPTATPTPTATPKPTPVQTPVWVPTPTKAPVRTPAPTLAPTAAPTPTPDPTATPEPVETPAETPIDGEEEFPGDAFPEEEGGSGDQEVPEVSTKPGEPLPDEMQDGVLHPPAPTSGIEPDAGEDGGSDGEGGDNVNSGGDVPDEVEDGVLSSRVYTLSPVMAFSPAALVNKAADDLPDEERDGILLRLTPKRIPAENAEETEGGQSEDEGSPEGFDEGEEITVYDTCHGKYVTATRYRIVSGMTQYEMGDDQGTTFMEPEMIKAQAVAADCFLTKKMEIAEKTGAEIRVGLKNPGEKTESAVRQVFGRKMYIEGTDTVIEATYYAISAGRTNNSEDVWLNAAPYLRSVESPWDKLVKGYRADSVVSAGDVKQAVQDGLGIRLSGSPKNWFSILEYNDGGYVSKLEVGGAVSYEDASGRESVITGNDIRDLVLNYANVGSEALRSSCFEVRYDEDSGDFTFTTYGYGHGVGMSQMGGNEMAKEGSTYQEILHHYYTGVEIR